METDIDPIKQISNQLARLQAENDRLKASEREHWRTQSDLREANFKLSEMKTSLDKANKRADDIARTASFWRECVWYEQKLKKCKRPRHIPNYSMKQRSRYDPNDSRWVNKERVFLKHWREENQSRRWMNGGKGVLELIMSNDSGRGAAPITQRDATVAATLIQWLGTNCGQAFISEVDAEHKKKKDAKR